MALILKIAGAILIADAIKSIFRILIALVSSAEENFENEQIEIKDKDSCVVIDINDKRYDN